MAKEKENNELNEENNGDESGQDKRLVTSRKRTESRRQQAVIRALLLFGILILVNVISINIFYRFDLTGNKIYTLSDASKNLVKNLDDKLVVKAYFTDNLPSPYNNTRRYLKEILDDYRNYSNGNFQYEIISPSDETELQKDAEQYGIQPVQVQTFKNDRAEAMKAYMGMVFLYGGKQESLPFIGNNQNLEYDITGVIKRMTEKELKKIGVLGGPGIPGLDKMSKANELISKYYNVTPVDASKNNPIPKDIAVLIVNSPKNQNQQMMIRQQDAPMQYPEYLKFAIDQYIMGGGKVIFLLNRITISSQQQFQFAQSTNTGIEEVLENYGIKFNNDIIRDKDCAYVSVPVSQGPLQFYTQIPFPYYPKITNINQNIPAFRGIGQIFLGFTCSIDTLAAAPKGVKVTPLLSTSGKTGVDKELSVIQATGKMPADSMFKLSNLVVGAIYDGVYNSFYNGKTIPADTSQGSSPAPAQVTPKSPQTKVVVIGNGDFAGDEFKGPEENTVFLSNMIDYLTDDVGLSEIKLKDANPKPLSSSIEESTKKIMKYGMMVLPPALVLIYGVFRWRKRKTARK